MTKKLYEENVYLKQVRCKVIEIIQEKDKNLVILDQTLFFPEGGGQKSDIGMMDDSHVIDVTIKDHIIYHEVDKVPRNSEVVCRLNWERRFDQMQQHCGEHILSGVFLEAYNLHNTGFHLGDDYVTIDVVVPSLNKEQIEEMERLANQAIWANQPIRIHTVRTSDEAKQYPLRKIPEIKEDVRIVEINDVDTVACCGTHPSFTGEVGILKITKWEKYKNMTRVYFKCGDRALKDYQKKHDIISDLSSKFSADIYTLTDKINKDGLKKKALLDELNSLRKQLSEKEANQLMNDAQDNTVLHLYRDLSKEVLQQIGNNIKLNDTYLYLIGSVKAGIILFSHDGKRDIECGKLIKENLNKQFAKGGGSKTNAQVMFTDETAHIEMYEVLRKKLVE